jgi:hypothetical protein
MLVRDSEPSQSSDRAAEDLAALAPVVFTTIFLAGLDEDPDAVLADGRAITSSSAYLILAALHADSTGVELIALLDSIDATHTRDYYQSGRQAEREGADGSEDESMDEPGSSSSSSASVSRSSSSSSSSPSSSSCSDRHTDLGVDSSERRKEQSIAKVRRAMTVDWECLVAVEYGDYHVPMSSLHTVRLLASIARQERDHLDTLAEDERDAGSEESGVESLHMSSDESDPEKRTERRRERHRDSAVEPADEPVDESASRQAPSDPLPVPAADPIPFDAELAAVQAEAAWLIRDDAVHDGLSPDDETALPLVRLVVPAVPVLVPLVTLTLSYVCGVARESAALVETLPSEPGVIPDPTLVLFVYTCTVQAVVGLGAASIVQGRIALVHRYVVLPNGFTKTMPVSAQTLARQPGVSTLDDITDAVTTVATTHHGVPFVRPTIEPTNTMTLYGRRIPYIASHVFLNLLWALKKRTMRKSNWYAVTPLRVAGAHCGALDAGLFRRRCRFFFAYLSSESVAPPTHNHVPELRETTTPSTESLTHSSPQRRHCTRCTFPLPLPFPRCNVATFPSRQWCRQGFEAFIQLPSDLCR